MTEAPLERPEGEQLDKHSLMQETEGDSGNNCVSTKGRERTRVQARKTGRFYFCLGKVSSQKGFLPGPRQPQGKEAAGGPSNTELDRGRS